MDGLFGVRMTGPLTPYAAGFAVELERVDYTSLSTLDQLRLLAHLNRWLDSEGLDVGDVGEAVVEAFLVARRAAGYRAHLKLASLLPLLTYLRGLGVSPPAQVASRTLVEQELERFRGYLLAERGLTPAAARGYVSLVRPFVVGRVGARGVDPQRVTAGEVTSFMVAASGRLGSKTVQRSASALRSLLRFWHLQGVVTTSLVEAVPKVAHRRRSCLEDWQPSRWRCCWPPATPTGSMACAITRCCC